jgi:thymidine kinase
LFCGVSINFSKTQGYAVNQKGNLIFFCGKMGAGKTTTSKTIAREKNAVLISEDEWLSAHYPNEINSFDDYTSVFIPNKSFC